MSNTDGASWEVSGPPAAPLDVLLTDKDDQMILARYALALVRFK